MTEHGFPSLANELVLQIAFYADDSSVLSLLLCNTSLCALMTPVLQTRAVLPHGPQTAMQWAAARGHLNLVKTAQFLLAHGVHPDDGASNKESAALWATVIHRRIDMVELLASHGAALDRQNYTAQSTFNPVAHDAAANGDAAMIKLLAARGANVESKNMMGMYVGTPLHLAVLNTGTDAVCALLDLHVPVNVEDSNWDFPLDMAAMVASDDADTEEWWELMVDIGKMLIKAGSPLRHSEEDLRRMSENPLEERTVKFYRLMAEAEKQLAMIE